MSTITDIPRDVFIKLFYLLDLPSHVAVSRVCKLFHEITIEAASQNPEIRLARVFHAVPVFSCVFTSEKSNPMGEHDEPQFMGRVVGNFLALLPFPGAREKENVLWLFSLSGPQLHKRFDLNAPIEACISVALPEPALIFANRGCGIKMVTLQELIEKNSSGLDLSDLTGLGGIPTKHEPLALAPNVIYFDSEKMDQTLRAPDFSPVFCLKGDLLAIAYQNSIKIIDRNNPKNVQTLVFSEARKLSIQDDQLVALSKDKCALWRLAEVGKIDDRPFFEVERNTSLQEPAFKFAEIFSGYAAIAYRQSKEIGSTYTVGALHDLKTKHKTDLVELKEYRGEPVLNNIIGVGDSRLVGASCRFMLWKDLSNQVSDLFGTSEVRDQGETAVHTMIKIDVYVLSASFGPHCLRLHSEKDFNKLTNLSKKFGLSDKDRVLSFEIAGRYALMEVRFQDKFEVKHSLKVFDLSGP